jgi:predicted nucleic acid-binding protein
MGIVVVDTSFLYAVYAERDDNHEAASEWYSHFEHDLVTTPVAVAEMDHLLRQLGPETELIVAANLATRALEVDWWDGAVEACWKVADARRDIGLADASLVALAAHRRTTRVATFDERHFRTLKPLTGEDAFTLLPLDAD